MTREELDFRPATIDDVPSIVELWAENARYHAELEPRFQYASDITTPIQNFYSHQLESAKSHIVVAQTGDVIIGYVCVFLQERPPIHIHRTVGFIDGLFVKPSFRRQGVGARLMHMAFDWLKEHNIIKTQLTVASRNPGAIEFWKKMGFAHLMHRLEFNSE